MAKVEWRTPVQQLDVCLDTVHWSKVQVFQTPVTLSQIPNAQIVHSIRTCLHSPLQGRCHLVLATPVPMANLKVLYSLIPFPTIFFPCFLYPSFFLCDVHTCSSPRESLFVKKVGESLYFRFSRPVIALVYSESDEEVRFWIGEGCFWLSHSVVDVRNVVLLLYICHDQTV